MKNKTRTIVKLHRIQNTRKQKLEHELWKNLFSLSLKICSAVKICCEMSGVLKKIVRCWFVIENECSLWDVGCWSKELLNNC